MVGMYDIEVCTAPGEWLYLKDVIEEDVDSELNRLCLATGRSHRALDYKGAVYKLVVRG